MYFSAFYSSVLFPAYFVFHLDIFFFLVSYHLSTFHLWPLRWMMTVTGVHEVNSLWNTGQLLGIWAFSFFSSLPHLLQRMFGVHVCCHVRLFETSWTAAYQAPLSMDISRQEYWSGLLFLLQGIFPTQASNHIPCVSRQILCHCATWEDILF